MRIIARGARVLGAIAAITIVTACGDATGPGRVSLDGDWLLSVTISSSSLGVSCQAAGPVTLSQDGQNFTGEVAGSSETCTGPGGTFYDNVDGLIVGGQIFGARVTYSDGTCDYDGLASGTPTNRISGDISCTVSMEGQDYPFTGTFLISR